MKTRVRIRVVLVPFVALVAAGCAAYSGATSEPRATIPTAVASNVNAQPSTAPTVSPVSDVAYPQAGITLRVPAASQVPAASVSDALATCNEGTSPCNAGVPEISLFAMSDNQMASIGADGTTTPRYQNVLVWALTWHDADCLVMGPPNRSAASSKFVCDHVVFVDAASGKYLFSYTGPSAA